MIRNPVDIARCKLRRLSLQPVEKMGAGEKRFERGPNSDLEAIFLGTGAVEHHQVFELVGLDAPAIGRRSDSAHDALGAGSLFR